MQEAKLLYVFWLKREIILNTKTARDAHELIKIYQ